MKLSIEIGVITNAVKAGFNKVDSIVRSSSNKIKSMMSSAFGALGLGLSVAGAIGASKKIVNSLDDIGKGAKKMQVTTDEYQKMSFAAERSGAGIENAQKAFKQIANVIDDARSGLTTAKLTLDKLGISMDDIKGKSPYEAFLLVVSALNKYSDGNAKAALATEVLGRGGQELIPFLKDYASLANELEASGSIIKKEDIANAEAFKDSLTNLEKVLTSVVIGTGFVKWLADIAKAMDEIVKARAAFQGGSISGKDSLDVIDKITMSREDQQKALLRGALKRNRGESIRNEAPTQAEISAKQKEIDARKNAPVPMSPEQILALQEKAKADKKAIDEAEKQKKIDAKSQEDIKAYIAEQSQKLKLQNMINQGKEKEAAIEEAIYEAQKKGKLSAEQKKTIGEQAGAIFEAGKKTDRGGVIGQPNPQITDSLIAIGANRLNPQGGNIENIQKTSMETLKKIDSSLKSIDEKTQVNIQKGGNLWP